MRTTRSLHIVLLLLAVIAFLPQPVLAQRAIRGHQSVELTAGSRY